MSVGLYINFKKETKEAIAFYEEVFGVVCNDLMTFGDAPSNPQHPISDAVKPLVMNASLRIHDINIMFSDAPEFMGHNVTFGNNISIVIELSDEECLVKEFTALSQDATIVMPLGETFWSKKYGYLIDKFGIGWQLSLTQ